MEEKEFFCSWKASKFLHEASFANARKVNVSEFQVKQISAEQSTLGFLGPIQTSYFS